MIMELLKPLIEWSGLGIIPLLLIVIIIIKLIKD